MRPDPRPAAGEGPGPGSRSGRRLSVASSTRNSSRSWPHRAPGRRPARLILTLEETFQAVRRMSAEVRVRTGFRSDGTITFREVEANYLLGAYADIADRAASKGSHISCGPIASRRRESWAGASSRTRPATAFRGFGAPQPNWAVESNMDEAARHPGPRPGGAASAQPRSPRRAVHPGKTPGRRRLGADVPPGRGADRMRERRSRQVTDAASPSASSPGPRPASPTPPCGALRWPA